MKKYLFVLSFFFAGFPIFCQLPSKTLVSIRVIDQNGTPVEGAVVNIEGIGFPEKSTGKDGIVNFEGIKEGKRKISIRKFPDYKLLEEDKIITSDSKANYFTFKLTQPESIEILFYGKVLCNDDPIVDAEVSLKIGSIVMKDISDEFGNYYFLINKDAFRVNTYSIEVKKRGFNHSSKSNQILIISPIYTNGFQPNYDNSFILDPIPINLTFRPLPSIDDEIIINGELFYLDPKTNMITLKPCSIEQSKMLKIRIGCFRDEDVVLDLSDFWQKKINTKVIHLTKKDGDNDGIADCEEKPNLALNLLPYWGQFQRKHFLEGSIVSSFGIISAFGAAYSSGQMNEYKERVSKSSNPAIIEENIEEYQYWKRRKEWSYFAFASASAYSLIRNVFEVSNRAAIRNSSMRKSTFDLWFSPSGIGICKNF